MDVACDMLNPHRRNNGTVMTLPPTPRNVAMAPIPPGGVFDNVSAGAGSGAVRLVGRGEIAKLKK